MAGAGTDTSFKIRNTLVVNTAFSVNSTGIYFGASPSLSLNSTFYAGQSAFVNTSGNFNVSGNLTINAALVADNTSGDPGQVLMSANTYTYWSTLAASAFTDTTNASNISTGTLAIARLPANAVSNAQLSANLANYPTSTQLTNNLANYPTSTNLTNNLANYQAIAGMSSYQTTAGLSANVATLGYQTTAGLSANVATLGYQTTAGLSANVATLTANNSTNFNGQAASYYTNGTNISTGTVVAARLPTDVLYTDVASQAISGGAIVTAYNIGTVSSGTTTINCGTRPLQYLTNNGAFTLAAPANDGSCVVYVLNGASAGAITFSGFTVGSSTGDALTTANASKFMIYIVRINGISTYTVKSLQ